MKWKKIDLHIHTKATDKDPKDRELTDEEIINKISALDIASFTNHDYFSKEEYIKYKDKIDLLLPGIELSLNGQHIIVISSPSQLDKFYEATKQWSEKINGKNSLSELEFNDIFGNEDYIYIPHLEKDPFNKDFIKNLNGFVVYEPSKFKDFDKSKNTLKDLGILDPVFIFGSDNRKDAEDVFIKTAKGFVDFKKSLKNQSNISNIRDTYTPKIYSFQPGVGENLFDINFETHGNLNVIIGKKGSGKSFLANLIGEESKKAFNKINQGKIDQLKDDKIFIKEIKSWIKNEDNFIMRNEISDDIFIQQYIDQTNKLDTEKVKLKTNLELLKEWAKQESANSYDNLTSLPDVEDYKSDDYDRLKLLALKLKEINDFSDLFNKEFNEALEKQIKVIDDKIRVHSISENKTLIKSLIHSKLKQLVSSISRTVQPKPPMDSIFKIPLYKKNINDEEENINTIISNFNKDEVKIELKESSNVLSLEDWNIYFKRSLYKNNKTANPLNKTQLESNKPFTEYLKNTEFNIILGEKSKFIEKNFIVDEVIIRNEKGDKPSGGQKSAIYIVRTFAEFNQKRIILDEVDSGFDSDIENDEMFRGIKELASKGKEVFIITHRPPVAINIEPDTIIQVTKKDNIRLVKSYTPGEAIENDLFEIVEGGKENYKYREEVYEN